ncbi:MAG: hypothetical protein PVI89_13870 [Desulfobacteraceae bacterium]|jgi:hypothetical protein
MKWMEILELRAAAGSDFLESIDLQALVAGLPKGVRPYRVVFFKHATVESDLCIHLMFDTDTVGRQGSEPGLWLKEILQAMGLVSHKIWVESASFQIPPGDDLP